jgi:hypothetical protein
LNCLFHARKLTIHLSRTQIDKTVAHINLVDAGSCKNVTSPKCRLHLKSPLLR